MGDASNNEKRKNNIHQQQLKEYFGQLEKKVATATDLLLIGPGVVKTQFLHHLQEQKHFATLKMKVLDANKMTHNQLQALVRESYLTAI
jgi:stalled ribosome rescue protein Dom34